MRILVSALVLLVLSCSSAFNKRQSLYVGDHEAFYRLKSASYPSEEIRAQLPKQTAFPDLDEDSIARLLATLKYRKAGLFGDTNRRIFYNEQLPEIAHRFKESQARLDETQRMVLIVTHDPDNSVLSHLERTTLVYWADEAGLNIVLGEIRQDIPHNDMLERQDWTSVLPVSMKHSYSDLRLIDSPHYQLKQINGSTHATWAVFPMDQLAQLPAIPPDNRVSLSKTEPASSEPAKPAKDNQPPVKSDPQLTRRLQDLKQALDQGLITQEEYDQKRKKILDSY